MSEDNEPMRYRNMMGVDYTCSTCKHDSKHWSEEPCDSCCHAHSGYEPAEGEVQKIKLMLDKEIDDSSLELEVINGEAAGGALILKDGTKIYLGNWGGSPEPHKME